MLQLFWTRIDEGKIIFVKKEPTVGPKGTGQRKQVGGKDQQHTKLILSFCWFLKFWQLSSFISSEFLKDSFWIFCCFLIMSEAFVIFTILCFINSVCVVIMPSHPTTTKLSGLWVAGERPQLSDVPPVIYYMETNIQWKKYLANHSFSFQSSSSSSGFLCSVLIAENNCQYIFILPTFLMKWH